MSFTGLHAFDRTVHTSNIWLKDLQRSLGWDDRRHAYAAFLAVVRTLRDRLPRDEAVQLAAQLPMLLAGAYVQGWRPAATPERMDEDEFLERVAGKLEESVPGADPRWAVRGVFDLLGRHVTPGELEDVVGSLPRGMRELWSSPHTAVAPGSGEEPSRGGAEPSRPGRLADWNVVATARPGGYEGAVRALAELAQVGSTEFFNVLVARVDDPGRFLEELRELGDRRPEVLDRFVSQVVPLAETFTFGTPEEFESAARRAVLRRAERLAGKSFHVRVHRHGLRGRLSSPEEERYLGGLLLDELESRGTPGTVTFDDPDVVVVVETVTTRGGVGVLTREELHRYPFLGVDVGGPPPKRESAARQVHV